LTAAWRDLRSGVRALRRTPGFAWVAITCLALGLGANTALFSVLNALVFRPLPFAEVERLVDVSEDNPAELCEGCAVGTSHGTLRAWRAATRSFTGLEAYQELPFTLGLPGGAERVSGAIVSGGLLDLLGVPPIEGRLLQPADDRPGAPTVVVLSHRAWQRWYGGEPGLVGREIRLNGVPRTVVGIMPAEFGFPEFALFWVPMAGLLDQQPADDRSLGVVGRLAPGVTLASAGAELASVAAAMAAEQPATHAGWTARVAPVERPLADSGANTGIALGLAAAGFVLLITCANLANLQLARGALRRREYAVRAALGASRRALVRAGLAESLILSLVGGLLGLVVGLWAVRGLLLVIGTEIPVWIDLSFDWRVFGFAAGLATAAGLLFGLAPALDAGRTDVQSALRAGGHQATGDRSGSRLRDGLVVAQVTLALALLSGAGLAVRSYLIVHQPDPRLADPRHELRGDLGLIEDRYADPEAVRRFGLELTSRLETLPGVAAAAVSHTGFLGSFVGSASQVFLEGRTEAVPVGQAPRFEMAVTPGFFTVGGLELARGRGIEPIDGPAAPRVAVVNEETARRLWPGLNPIGRRLRIGNGPDSRDLAVVGVVRDVISQLGRSPVALVYTPFAQGGGRPLIVQLRATGAPAALASELRAAVQALDPSQPVENLMTGEAHLAASVAPVRFMATILAALGMLALVLAAFGLYSLLSYLVARRTREFGIRVALGAVPAQLRRQVLLRAGRLVGMGFLLGVPLALATGRVVRSTLFGIAANDPLVLFGAPLFLAATALAAAYLPARRATAVDPVVALRAD